MLFISPITKNIRTAWRAYRRYVIAQKTMMKRDKIKRLRKLIKDRYAYTVAVEDVNAELHDTVEKLEAQCQILSMQLSKMAHAYSELRSEFKVMRMSFSNYTMGLDANKRGSANAFLMYINNVLQRCICPRCFGLGYDIGPDPGVIENSAHEPVPCPRCGGCGVESDLKCEG